VLVGCGRFTQKKQKDWRDYYPPDRLMAEASSRALRDTTVSPERVLSALDAIAGNSVVPDRFYPSPQTSHADYAHNQLLVRQ